MKKLILYKSKWGATKLYAEWIKDKVKDCDVKSIDDFDSSRILDYDRIVVGSRTYMGKIEVQNFLEINWESLSKRKVYLFSVGMINWEKEDSKKAYESISQFVRDGLVGHVKLGGRIVLSKLNLFEKLLVKFMKVKNLDKMDKDAISPIVEFLEN